LCVPKTADGYNVTCKSVRVVDIKSAKAVAATPSASGQWRFIAAPAFIPPRRVYSRHRIRRLRRHYITPLYCGIYSIIIIIIIIANIYTSAKYNNNNGLMVSYYTYLRYTYRYIIECPDFKISRFCEFRS